MDDLKLYVETEQKWYTLIKKLETISVCLLALISIKKVKAANTNITFEGIEELNPLQISWNKSKHCY